MKPKTSCDVFGSSIVVLAALKSAALKIRPRLKDDLRSELEDSRIERPLWLSKPRSQCQALIRKGPGHVIERRPHVVEVGAIENIEPLGNQLQPCVFSEPELSSDPGIKADEIRPGERVAANSRRPIGETVAVIVQIRAGHC